jgi:hypothetical protein
VAQKKNPGKPGKSIISESEAREVGGQMFVRVPGAVAMIDASRWATDKPDDKVQ